MVIALSDFKMYVCSLAAVSRTATEDQRRSRASVVQAVAEVSKQAR